MRSIVTTALLTIVLLLAQFPSAAQDESAVRTAWLGVTLGQVVVDTAADSENLLPGLGPTGARVSGVVSDSPAARSGLRAGDIVLTVDGRPVDSPTDLVTAIGESDPGLWVELQITRRDEERSVTVRLGDRPAVSRRLDIRRGWAGLTLIDVPRQLQEAWGGEDGTGVLVGAVAPGSPAELGGVLPGDLVLTIDGQPVRGAYELLPRLRGGGVGNELELGLSRQGTFLDVSVELLDEPPREEQEEREGRRRSDRRIPRMPDFGRDGNANIFTTEFLHPDQVIIIDEPREASPER